MLRQKVGPRQPGEEMPADRVERRLTAILAADIAGYSRLMGEDEEGTLAQPKAHRRALVDPQIDEHRGRIIKTTGDGMLVEFATVVDAVSCAVHIQCGMAVRNGAVPPQRRIEFRVGINVGDIIIEGSDIFGEAVNVAARLEGLAERVVHHHGPATGGRSRRGDVTRMARGGRRPALTERVRPCS